jgi:hypothetical protein
MEAQFSLIQKIDHTSRLPGPCRPKNTEERGEQREVPRTGLQTSRVLGGPAWQMATKKGPIARLGASPKILICLKP